MRPARGPSPETIFFGRYGHPAGLRTLRAADSQAPSIAAHRAARTCHRIYELYPPVTFFQLAMHRFMATLAPLGYGHVHALAHGRLPTDHAAEAPRQARVPDQQGLAK